MAVTYAHQQLRRHAQAGDTYDVASILLKAGCKSVTEVVKLAYPLGRVSFRAFDCLTDAWAMLGTARLASEEPGEVQARLTYLRTKEK